MKLSEVPHHLRQYVRSTQSRASLMGWTPADLRKAASAAVNGEAPISAHATGTVGSGVTYSAEDNTGSLGVSKSRTDGARLLAALQHRFGAAPGVRVKTGEYAISRDYTRDGKRGDMAISDKPVQAGVQSVTAPSTPLAQQWDGWATALKPSYEVCILARVPFTGPVRENVRKHGVGAVNIEAARIPIGDGDRIATATHTAEAHNASPCYGDSASDWTTAQHPSGRYPSNLIVSDEALGERDSRFFSLDAWASAHGFGPEWQEAAEAGLVQVAKAGLRERNAGCEGLPLMTAKQRTDISHIDHKDVIDRKDGKGPVPVNATVQPAANRHPTCKSVTLMSYLLTLLCPPGGTVIEPFAGSGTTCVSAILGGWRYVAFEREDEYVAIAEARTAWARSQVKTPEPAPLPATALQLTF